MDEQQDVDDQLTFTVDDFITSLKEQRNRLMDEVAQLSSVIKGLRTSLKTRVEENERLERLVESMKNGEEEE